MQDSENYELDPNFAVVCSFLERFGKHVGEGFADLSIDDLKSFLEAKEVDVNNPFVRLHLVLFRGVGSYHKREDWVKGVIKFCKDFPDGDDELVKENGYTDIPISVKLRILKNLCEDQFEYNDRFNRRVNEQLEEGTSIRHEPIGRDKLGRAYWFMQDQGCGMRLFRGWYNDLTRDERWNIVCSEVEELENVIRTLEESENLKQEDPILPKAENMSPVKKVSVKDLLKTATEDAANAVYFTSSPRFFKPPKPRQKDQILQDEENYDLPHCEVVISRLPQREIDKYTKKEKKPEKLEKDNNTEEVTSDSKSSPVARESEIQSLKNPESQSRKLCSESEAIKKNSSSQSVKTNSNLKGLYKKPVIELVKIDAKVSPVKRDLGSESVKISCDTKSVKKNTKSVKGETIYKEKRSKSEKKSVENKKESVDSLDLSSNSFSCKNDLDTTIGQSKKSSNRKKCKNKSQTGETVNNILDESGNDQPESENITVKDKQKGRERPTSESEDENFKNSAVLEKESKMSEKEEEKMLPAINCRGDADSKGDRKNETQTDIRQEESLDANHSIHVSENSGTKNLSGVNEDEVDENEVFNNAIQDLIQLEGKSVNKSQSLVSDATQCNKTASKSNVEGLDTNKTKSKKWIEKKGKNKDKADDSETVSDNSVDSDKKVIDNALKDLIELEEMVSLGSPPHNCSSPPVFSDLGKPVIQENKGTNLDKAESDVSDDKDTDEFPNGKLKDSESLQKGSGEKSAEKMNASESSVQKANKDSVFSVNTDQSSGKKYGDIDDSVTNVKEVKSNFEDTQCLVEDKLIHKKETKDSVEESNTSQVDISAVGTGKQSVSKTSVTEYSMPESGTRSEEPGLEKSECDTSIEEPRRERSEWQADKFKGNNVNMSEGKCEIRTEIIGTAKSNAEINGNKPVTAEPVTVTAEQVSAVKAENGDQKISKMTQGNAKGSLTNTAVPCSEEKDCKKSLVNENDIKVEPKCEVLQETGHAADEKKIVDRKSLSMMVGDEMIHIEEATDISDGESKPDGAGSESKTESGNESKTESASECDSCKTPETGKSLEGDKNAVGKIIQQLIEKNLKIITQVKDEDKCKPVRKLNAASKSGLKDKVVMKTLYASNTVENLKPNIIYIHGKNAQVSTPTPPLIVKNTLANASVGNPVQSNVIYLAAENTMNVPLGKPSQTVAHASAVSVKNQTSSSVASLLKTISVPLVTVAGNLHPGVNNNLPANSSQLPNLNSIILKPVPSVQPASALPYVQTVVPRIMYASGQAPIITLPPTSIQNSSHFDKTKPAPSSLKSSLNSKIALKSLLIAKSSSSVTPSMPNIINATAHAETVQINSAKKEETMNVPMKSLTIVVGKDGIEYNKETGKPLVYPQDKKLIVAGPNGKFYHRATGYEVNVPASLNLKHIPGVMYLASGVTFPETVVNTILSKKIKKMSSGIKRSRVKKDIWHEDSSASDEDFENMLESDSGQTSTESDDPSYDYDKISQHIKAVKDKKLPAKSVVPKQTADSEVESEEETVPLVLGRNAKRAAARKSVNYKEPVSVVIETEESSEESTNEIDDWEPCKVCNTGDNPSTILLCDKCDSSYHMSCLFPPLSLVPLEDWFCPQCEHEKLIESLKEKLEVVKKAHRRYIYKQDRISQKTFSIDTENIVLGERRSRNRKEVSYNEDIHDKIIHKAVREYNDEKKRADSSSSGSDTEIDLSYKHLTAQYKQKKSGKKMATKRQRNESRKSGRTKEKRSSEGSKAKKRKLTSLKKESDDSDSDYVQSDQSESSDTEVDAPDQDDAAIGGTYYTSSGRKTKHVSYT